MTDLHARLLATRQALTLPDVPEVVRWETWEGEIITMTRADRLDILDRAIRALTAAA